MKTRTFTTDFSYEVDDSTRRTFPQGWSGEVEDDVAEAADAAGATDKPASKKGKAGATDAPPAPEDAPPA